MGLPFAFNRRDVSGGLRELLCDESAANTWTIHVPLIDASLAMFRLGTTPCTSAALGAIGHLVRALGANDLEMLDDFVRAMARAERRRLRVREERRLAQQKIDTPNVIDLLGWLRSQLTPRGDGHGAR